jgi:putative acetyltransferase
MTTEDSDSIHNLHVVSIKFYCSKFYTENIISAWVNSKSAELYKHLPEYYKVIVVETKNIIVGFGAVNLNKNSIDSIYVLPNFSKKGVGSLILENLEKIAKANNATKITLSSTLNAVDFYHAHGYGNDVKDKQILKSGIEIACVNMEKILSQ